MIGENVDCVAMFVVFVADMVPDDWRECRLCSGIEIRKNFYMSAGHVTMSD